MPAPCTVLQMPVGVAGSGVDHRPHSRATPQDSSPWWLMMAAVTQPKGHSASPPPVLAARAHCTELLSAVLLRAARQVGSTLCNENMTQHLSDSWQPHESHLVIKQTGMVSGHKPHQHSDVILIPDLKKGSSTCREVGEDTAPPSECWLGAAAAGCTKGCITASQAAWHSAGASDCLMGSVHMAACEAVSLTAATICALGLRHSAECLIVNCRTLDEVHPIKWNSAVRAITCEHCIGLMAPCTVLLVCCPTGQPEAPSPPSETDRMAAA